MNVVKLKGGKIMQLNTNTSIVDWLKANGQDSSMGNRAQLAQRFGIAPANQYTGSYNQNVNLLNYVKAHGLNAPAPAAPAPAPAPAPTPAPPPPTISPEDKAWYDQYVASMKNGSNDISQAQRYFDLQNKWGLGAGQVDPTVMADLSRKAYNGDATAQSYLDAMKFQKMTGSGLWNGYDMSGLQEGSGLWKEYMSENPTSDIAKNYDMRQYSALNDLITGNKPVTDDQLNQYNAIVNTWNLDNMQDPYMQYKHQLQTDKQQALDAQDTALNQGMATMDSNSFNQMQQLQQQMEGRGISDSGLAADAYMRAVMGNNQNYQQAYAQAATNKADTQKSYDDAIAKTATDRQSYIDSRTDATNKTAIDEQNAQTELFKAQSDADKNMTDATGYVYVNGKPLKDSSGNPISSLEYMKLSETQRHDIASENNVAIGNQLTYEAAMNRNAVDAQNGYYQYVVGMDRNQVTAQGNQLQYASSMDANNVKRMQISADLSMAADKLKYDYATLDLKSTQVSADIQNAAAKLDIMARDSSTKELSAKAGVLKSQLSNVQSQINAYVKAGQTPPSSLKTTLADIMSQMETLATQGK
jgi:hypothetical protein